MFAVDTVSYPPILTSGDSLCRLKDKKKSVQLTWDYQFILCLLNDKIALWFYYQ